MNILIIEDEILNSDRLIRLVKKIKPRSNVLCVLESVNESVQWLQNNAMPDVIMMDIQLPDGNSFDIFSHVKIECPIIFTTAFDQHAIRAFKYNSIDYLLKPIEEDDLIAAFEKLAHIRENSIDSTKYFKAIQDLMNFNQVKEYRKRFLIPFRDGFKTLFVNDIVFFNSEHRITRAYFPNGQAEVIVNTLEELEEQLDPHYFFRINRQYIVHVDSIGNIYNHFNSKLKVILKKFPDIEIIVSREKAALLKDWIGY